MQTSKCVINITLAVNTVCWKSSDIFPEAKQDVLVDWVGKEFEFRSGRKDYHHVRWKGERTEQIMMGVE